jgi:putative hydrolase of the HAD superfamily
VVKEYESIGENDIRWYIPEYWFTRFNLKSSIDSMLDRLDYKSALYDDVYLLNDLASMYKLIIATCNPDVIARRKIKALGIKHIDYVFSSISYGVLKSKDFYMRICNILNVNPNNILHVGDNIMQDLIIPRSIGMQALIIDRYYKLSNEYNDYIIHSLNDLVDILM